MENKTRLISTHFGRISTNKGDYEDDVWINVDGSIEPRIRKRNHILNIQEVEHFIPQKPDILLFGTGQYGDAEVEEEIKEKLKSKKIKLIEQKTPDAIRTYNQLVDEEKRICAVLHVTC